MADLLRRTLADGSIPVQLTTASLATAIEETPDRAAAARLTAAGPADQNPSYAALRHPVDLAACCSSE